MEGGTAVARLPMEKPAPLAASTSSSACNIHGCEHIQALLREKDQASTISNSYIQIIHNIFDRPSVAAQTYRFAQGGQIKAAPAITATYLCLQCPFISSPEYRDKHSKKEGHAFSVESRQGYVYCQRCQDFIYDYVLEELRTHKGKRKRKFDEAYDLEDQKLVAINSNAIPCRAVGLRGLYNMGQTCFMGVVLQSLIHNPLIRNFYLSEGHKPGDCEKTEGCASCAMEEIYTEFYSVEKTEGFGAVNMLMASWLGAQALAGYQQQDAHEYMQFILNALHGENGGSADSQDTDSCFCIIHKTFYGSLQSTVTCDKCKNVTTAVDPFMDLSLDLKSQVKKRKLEGDASAASTGMDLVECLQRFTHEEKLSAADYTCQNCDEQRDATKHLTVQKLPPVLIIHLKRFSHTKEKSTKIETPVNFPETLDLFPFTTPGWQPRPAPSQKPTKSSGSTSPAPTVHYCLQSVIQHKGGMDSGHYICYAREAGEWFLFDDAKVNFVQEQDVLNAEAYLLFYTLKTLD